MLKTNKTITLDLEVIDKLKYFNNVSGLINRLLQEELGMRPKKCEQCEKLKKTIKQMQDHIFKQENEIQK